MPIFKLAGFIIGIDAEKKILTIRPSNTIIDKEGGRYGVGITDQQAGILINLERDNNGYKSFINFRYKENKENIKNVCGALLYRGKVWLTVKSKRTKQPFDGNECTAMDVFWSE